MDQDKYHRNITLLCQTCGGDQFKFDDADDQSPVTCQACEQVFTRSELIEANAENIETHKNEMIDDIRSDIRKDFKNMFKGNKWKIR